ncbi:hypothetical protein PT974_07993 [Cladobotryum mycophilum]|uniref:Uncharacterized protein n=1 Tax=Cladobotryum mycophilum TaxID=491253 RepID=A0ABR0SCP0_9HYPO
MSVPFNGLTIGPPPSTTTSNTTEIRELRRAVENLEAWVKLLAGRVNPPVVVPSAGGTGGSGTDEPGSTGGSDGVMASPVPRRPSPYWPATRSYSSRIRRGMTDLRPSVSLELPSRHHNQRLEDTKKEAYQAGEDLLGSVASRIMGLLLDHDELWESPVLRELEAMGDLIPDQRRVSFREIWKTGQALEQ